MPRGASEPGGTGGGDGGEDLLSVRAVETSERLS